MANVRWKDKSDIVALADTDRIPVTDDVGVSNTDKYFTALEMATYVGTGLTMTGTLACGANVLSGSAIAFTGGTIDAITNLIVDDIQINGQVISSTGSNKDIQLTPHGTGEVVIEAGNFNYAGTAVTTTGTELNYVGGVESQIGGLTENHAAYGLSVTGTTTTLSAGGKIDFNTTSNAITATMPIITTGKSEEFICTLIVDGGDDVTIVDNGADGGFIKADGSTTGTSITLDSAGDVVFLKSPAFATGKWMIIGGYGYILA
jgi:hypothetical protein